MRPANTTSGRGSKNSGLVQTESATMKSVPRRGPSSSPRVRTGMRAPIHWRLGSPAVIRNTLRELTISPGLGPFFFPFFPSFFLPSFLPRSGGGPSDSGGGGGGSNCSEPGRCPSFKRSSTAAGSVTGRPPSCVPSLSKRKKSRLCVAWKRAINAVRPAASVSSSSRATSRETDSTRSRAEFIRNDSKSPAN